MNYSLSIGMIWLQQAKDRVQDSTLALAMLNLQIPLQQIHIS
jgi:hypothetical protein